MESNIGEKRRDLIKEKEYYKIMIKEMVDVIDNEDYLFGIYHFTKYKYEKEKHVR